METPDGLVLLVNKPLEWTSFDVVKKLRFALRTPKVGHAGTLDPLATGLLIVCTGKMTKRIEEFQGMEKEYTGSLVLGQSTPSYDMETLPGPATDISCLTEESIRDAAAQFVGTIEQIPPLHSSVKVDGKRAYEIARKGKTAELKPRQVHVYEFEITAFRLPEVEFRVVCSKGTYIRSLANDLGRQLGVGAYLSRLCRTRIGTYRLENAESIDQIHQRFGGMPTAAR